MGNYEYLLIDALNKNQFAEKMFLNICRSVILSNNLESEISDIIIKDSNGSFFRGIYVSNTITLYIRKENYGFYDYRKAFKIFFHELTHVIQLHFFKNYPKDKWILSEDEVFENIRYHIYELTYQYIFSDRKSYKKFHNLIPTEREANYCGLIYAYTLLKESIPDLTNILIEKNALEHELLNILTDGYRKSLIGKKIICPLETYHKKSEFEYFLQSIGDYKSLNIKYRLLFGLPIEKSEFDDLEKNDASSYLLTLKN